LRRLLFFPRPPGNFPRPNAFIAKSIRNLAHAECVLCDAKSFEQSIAKRQVGARRIFLRAITNRSLIS